MQVTNPSTKPLDIIIPLALESDAAPMTEKILTLHQDYGFSKFALFFPSKGWRGHIYPPTEHYIEYAHIFRTIKDALQPLGIVCGWWACATIKAGPDNELESIIRADGSPHPFAFCPLGKSFTQRFAKNTALFAKIGEPDFILFEDDYSLKAAGGCFCEHHVKEFSKRQNKTYTREELTKIFAEKTPESYALLKAWRELLKDSLVELATAIRKELDKESPQISMGLCQSGGVDYDGNSTEAISRALAGEKHTPFTRLYGTFYCGVNVKQIPEELYHSLCSKQRLDDQFLCYHESDSYPHSKYFTAGKHMKAIMATAFSFGCDGSLFQVAGLDNSIDGCPYATMYANERARFEAVHQIAKQSDVKGVEIAYDPFWNTADESYSTINPLWVNCLSRFGIPYTTINAPISFWDVRQATHADHDTIMAHLSTGLFLDGDAAKALCDRGYGKYLGVDVEESVIAGTNLHLDLGCYELMCEKFAPKGKARKMAPAHCYAPPGNGIWRKLTVTNQLCEVVTEAYTSQHQLLCPTMTRFTNELGGKIVVMSLTLDGNHSQALLNYPRQQLLQDLLVWCDDSIAFAKNAPDVSVIMNEAKNMDSGFLGMLTLVNLCEDELTSIALHLPPHWQNANFFLLDSNGEWNKVTVPRTNDGIEIKHEMKFCEPIYILVQEEKQ